MIIWTTPDLAGVSFHNATIRETQGKIQHVWRSCKVQTVKILKKPHMPLKKVLAKPIPTFSKTWEGEYVFCRLKSEKNSGHLTLGMSALNTAFHKNKTFGFCFLGVSEPGWLSIIDRSVNFMVLHQELKLAVQNMFRTQSKSNKTGPTLLRLYIYMLKPSICRQWWPSQW